MVWHDRIEGLLFIPYVNKKKDKKAREMDYDTLAESVQVNAPWSRAVYRRCPTLNVNLFSLLVLVECPSLSLSLSSFRQQCPPINSCEWGWISFFILYVVVHTIGDVSTIYSLSIWPIRGQRSPKTALKVSPAVRFPVHKSRARLFIYSPVIQKVYPLPTFSTK